MSKVRIFGLGFGILLILAAFGIVLWQSANMPATQTAFAQGAATATPAANATPVPQEKSQQQQQSQIGDNFWTLLAGKLGVSADDLKSKAVQARQEMIDQAVKDGRVTQEQADALKQRINSNNIIAPISLGRGARPNLPPQGGNQPNQTLPRGPFRGPGPVIGPGFGGFGIGRGGFGSSLQELQAVATALKLEPKALIQQLSQGKSLADIAKAQGVDEAAVKQAIIDFRKAQIDQQLALGLISEVQANQLKARLTPENIDLSRGYRFNFNIAPTQDGQSFQVTPDFGMSETFDIAPNVEIFGDSGEFAIPFDQFAEPYGDVQTQ